MTPLDIATSALIFLGAAVMFLSILGTRSVLRMVRQSRFSRHWQVLGVLMVFFLAGYLAAIVLLGVGLKDLLTVLTGAVFLFGALFVYLVVLVGRSTIEELRERSNELQAQQDALQASYDEAIRLQEKAIASQRVAAELSTPVIPISAGILAMPLIGSIDAERAQHITESLLQEVSRRRARVVIIDITGVPTLNVMAAEALLRVARGVHLLGAEPLLTGIRAEVAQTLVGSGLDLSGLTVHATLEEGLAYALHAAAGR